VRTHGGLLQVCFPRGCHESFGGQPRLCTESLPPLTTMHLQSTGQSPVRVMPGFNLPKLGRAPARKQKKFSTPELNTNDWFVKRMRTTVRKGCLTGRSRFRLQVCRVCRPGKREKRGRSSRRTIGWAVQNIRDPGLPLPPAQPSPVAQCFCSLCSAT
jgi:hypothetical protein